MWIAWENVLLMCIDNNDNNDKRQRQFYEICAVNWAEHVKFVVKFVRGVYAMAAVLIAQSKWLFYMYITW